LAGGILLVFKGLIVLFGVNKVNLSIRACTRFVKALFEVNIMFWFLFSWPCYYSNVCGKFVNTGFLRIFNRSAAALLFQTRNS
jgi:hypothetical protein